MAAISRVSSDHVATLDDFQCIVRESTVKAECGREFIRVDKLMGWLESPGPSLVEGGHRKQIDLLARAAYRDHLPNDIRPAIHESLLLKNCPLTFCVLVELGHGNLVHEFQRYHLTDRNLETMDSSTLREKIKKHMNINDSSSKLDPSGLAKRFDELRWKYFAPKFDLRLEGNFSKDRILPIVRKQAFKNGGTAKLYKIEILEEFVGDNLRKEVCESVKEGKDGVDKVSYK